MASTATNPKQQAHKLIEQLSASQVTALVSLLETILGPASAAVANAPGQENAPGKEKAPVEDEPQSEEQARTAAAARAWLAEHLDEGAPHEELLAEFGITPDDIHRK